MVVRRAILDDGTPSVALKKGDRWIPLMLMGCKNPSVGTDVLEFLRKYREEDFRNHVLEKLDSASDELSSRIQKFTIPFRPLSFRDFMLWEEHYVNSVVGLLKRFMPGKYRTVSLIKRITGRFPIKPPSMFYEVPVYYMGNHNQFYESGRDIPYPSYTKFLDYELEIGLVIVDEVRNARGNDALRAIGGFVILNDFTARDMQVKEFRESPFGPVVKAKNFATGISLDVATADGILPRFESITGRVYVNGQQWCEGSTRNPAHPLEKMVEYASLEETLYPGEILGTGTLPGCAGVEIDRFLSKGDTIELEVDGIGTLENRIV